MITITTKFLGMDVTARVFRDSTNYWFIDDYSVDCNGRDFSEYLNDRTLAKLWEHIKIEADYYSHRFL